MRLSRVIVLVIVTLLSLVSIPASAAIGYPMAVTIYYKNESGAQVAPTHADEGITGTAMSKREEFKRLLNDAKLGRIDRVFCAYGRYKGTA